MFYSLTGTLVHTSNNEAAIDCNGVAYLCNVSLNTLKRLGQKGSKVTLYTYLNVKEDALDLFGFYDMAEKDMFTMLIGVSKVGPKAALSILSELEPQNLALSIATGDYKVITKAQGVGPKLAQRIVLELKDKVAKSMSGSKQAIKIESVSNVALQDNTSQAIEALVMLGYSQTEAAVVVGKLDSSLTVEELIKQSLKELSM